MEAVAALRALAGPRPRITAAHARARNWPRARPRSPRRSASGCPGALPYDAIQPQRAVRRPRGTLAGCEPEAHVVVDRRRRRRRFEYDALMRGRRGAAAARRAGGHHVRRAGRRRRPSERALEETSRMAFVVPPRLGLGAAGLRAGDHGRHRAAQPRARARDHGRDAGARPAGGVRRRGRRGDQPRCSPSAGSRCARGARAVAAADGDARGGGRAARARRPGHRAAAPDRAGRSPGSRRTAHGFIAGRRARAGAAASSDVYAAGDATTFPLKQGGLATQQADAAAETIAAELGAAGASRRRSGPSCAGSC